MDRRMTSHRTARSWLIAAALNALFAAYLAASASASVTEPAKFEPLPDSSQPQMVLFEVQPALPTAYDDGASADRRTNEIVNPVPLSPQLWTGLITLAGAVIVRYRRSMLNWLT